MLDQAPAKEVKKVAAPSLVSSDVFSPSADLREAKVTLDPEVSALIERVRANDPTLTSLAPGRFGNGEVKALADALKSNTVLTSLTLTIEAINAEGVEALAVVLEHNTTLTWLQLSPQKIGVRGIKALAAVLESNTTLTSLHLDYSEIGDDGAEILAAALSHNKTLTTLALRDNKIGYKGAKALATALAKDTTSICYLYLEGNNIGTEGAKAFATILAHNTTLVSLFLTNNKIDADGAKALATALENNATLSTLGLCGNNIGADGAKALISSTTLTWLMLSVRNISDDEVKALIAAIERNTTLIMLGTDYWNISKETKEAIKALLARNRHRQKEREAKATTDLREAKVTSNPEISTLIERIRSNDSTLTSLDLSGKKIGDGEAKALATALEINTTLTSLTLDDSHHFGEYVLKAFVIALERNTTMTSLDFGYYFCHEASGMIRALLWRNKISTLTGRIKANDPTLTAAEFGLLEIDNDQLKALVDALELNTMLTSLDVRVPSDRIKILLELRRNTTLTKLKLAHNSSLDDSGAKILAAGLKTNTTLLFLDLQCNDIGDEGVIELAEALESNATLTSLQLHHNTRFNRDATKEIGVGDGGAKALAAVLVRNTPLAFLGLGWNVIQDDGAKALAEALKSNTTLTSLQLCRNPIGDEGVKAFAAALVHNTTLTSLDLSDLSDLNSITVEGVEALAAALEHNTTLTSLPLEHLPTYCDRGRAAVKTIGTLLARNLRLKEEREAKTTASITGPAAGAESKLSTPPLSGPSLSISAEEAHTLRAQVVAIDRRVGKVETNLNHRVITKLHDSEAALDRVIEGALKKEAKDAEHTRVLKDEHLTAYYCMFLVLLEGSWRACENIYSGFTTHAPQGKVDQVTQALDAAGGLIPGLGIPFQIISSVIKAKNFVDKKQAVHNIAFFFSQEKMLPEVIIRTLARRLAIEQADSLNKLFKQSPAGFKAKAKQGYRELKNWILSDKGHNPVMTKAREDIERLITAIAKGELVPPTDYDQMARCAMGKSFVAAAAAKSIVSPGGLMQSNTSFLLRAPLSLESSAGPGTREVKVQRSSLPAAVPPTSSQLAVGTDGADSSPREKKAQAIDTPSPAELLAIVREQAAKLAALEVDNEKQAAKLVALETDKSAQAAKLAALETARTKSEEELAKVKKDLDSSGLSTSGSGGQSQAQASARGAGHAHGGGYDPSFQAVDEERRRVAERELALQRELLAEHADKLAAHDEQLGKKLDWSKCIIQ